MQMMTQSLRDFNQTLSLAISETLVEVLGRNHVRSVYSILLEQYSITLDELPYRLETLYEVLENTFGIFGAKTLGSVIAEKFFEKEMLVFENHDGFSLTDYVEIAKSKPQNS